MRTFSKHGSMFALSLLLAAAPLPGGKADGFSCSLKGSGDPVPSEQTDSSPAPDILNMLGISESITADGEPGAFLQTDTVLSVSCEFREISLRQVLLIAGQLADSRWFMTGQTAVKGNRTLRFGYDDRTRLLKLDYIQEADKPEWPDVLTPALSTRIPVFTFGRYVSGEPLLLPDRVDVMKLTYEEVSPADMSAYGQLLAESGYSLIQTPGGNTEYSGGTLYVSLLYNPENRRAEVTVGAYLIYPVPLPPWPDTLPENIRRLLPAVAAVCKADKAEGGYRCSAEGLTLFGLYSFVQTAMRYDNWSELSDKGFMTNIEPSVSLEILSYSTQTETLVFFLHTDDAGIATSAPEATPLPARTAPPDTELFDDGLTDYYFKLTRGLYSENEALAGLLEEFGQAVEMADWSELKGLYPDTFNLFLSSLEVNVNEDIWVAFEGTEFFGQRHYFLARIAGVPRQGFLLHDQAGDEAWLGSWYGLRLRVLAKVPAGE